MTTRIGILTGGGDCPGLNAAIRAVVRAADRDGIQVYGFEDGWRGVLHNRVALLTTSSTRGLLTRGGTILGSSRVNPWSEDGGVELIERTIGDHRLDGLVVIGGEGTLSASARLHEEHGVPIIGIPKTIDNDVGGTDFSIGFPTAIDIATGAIDRLHSTAESHNRIMVLEVMGRHAGWIATMSGMAGGADAILIPEVPFDVDAVARHLRHRLGMGRDFSIVVVAEGARPAPDTITLPEAPLDEFGRPRLGGIATTIAAEIEDRMEMPARFTILGHVQRGGTPNAMDRVLATQMGVAAVEAAQQDRWGHMMAYRRGRVDADLTLAEAVAELKTVPESLYQVAEVFFG